MPLAPVDCRGTQLHYEDSGPPHGSATYTTLMLVHGVYFNSGIFSPMIPYAAQNNLRLVLLNARDNGQSTPYTDEELKLLRSSSKEHQVCFIQQRVVEYAAFLRWYIGHEKIPLFRECDGKQTGGINLVFWSGGNCLGIPFFAYSDVIPEDTRKVLEEYLRSYVIYDATIYAAGLPIPPMDELYSPFRDPSWTPQHLVAAFLPSLLGHYNNDGPITYKAFQATKLEDLPSRPEFCRSLHWEPGSESYQYSVADFDAFTELGTLNRSAIPILLIDREIHAACTDKMLNDEEFAKRYFPRTKVVCVACTRSASETMYGMYGMKKSVLERAAAGRTGREVTFHMFEEANHMWHWLKPEIAATFFAGVV